MARNMTTGWVFPRTSIGLGIASICLMFIMGLFLYLPAIVLGVLGLIEGDEEERRQSIWGLLLGVAGLAATIIWLVAVR